MEQVWREAPAAALRVWAGPPLRIEPNAAALSWALAHGVTEAHLTAWVVSQWPAARSGPPPGLGPMALAVRCHTVPLDDGAVLWMMPADTLPAETGGRLDLLKSVGRIGLYVRDLRSGQGRWDRHLFELVGLPPSERAPDWSSFLARCVHPDDRQTLDRRYRHAAASLGEGEYRFRVVRPDGAVRLMHAVFEVRPGPDGRPMQMVGVLIDDTEGRRELLDALDERRQLERAIELAGVSVWRVDLAAQRVQFNSVGFDIVGMENRPEGVDLDGIRESIHPADRAAVVAAANAALASDRIIDVEARYRTSTGDWLPLLTRRVAERDAQGRPVALAGVSLDVRQLVAERESAAALAEQTRMAAQAIGVGFWSRDGEDGPILWDGQMYRLYDRDPARPAPGLGEWLAEHVHDSDRERVRRLVEADIARAATSTLMTLRVATTDGSERWARAWTRRMSRPDGRRQFIGMHMDVTELVRLEELQAQAELTARASREKSALMALLSHRLRTPLNAVLGFAQLLAQDGAEPLSARQRERLARIDASGQELLAMVDDVFELAGLDAGQGPAARVPVPIRQVVAQVAEAVEPLARQRGVALQVQVDADLSVSTDRRLLSQALKHLVAHGVRRNERGGWVAVHAAADAQAGRCRLVVTDGGPHEPAQQRELLFDGIGPLRGAGASGDPLIGLDLVRHVLERLDGRVEALRDEGSGFVVRLPLADPPSRTAPRQGLRLLCVEDNPVNLMLVQELVAMRPAVQLLCAVDGESGLELAAAERPDAVLLDLQLPDIPGTTVLERLRADPALAGCTVIALSANALPQDIRSALALGFDDYWTKPIDFDVFLAGLDRLARQRTSAVPAA